MACASASMSRSRSSTRLADKWRSKARSLRTTSKEMGARKNPMAEPTPAPVGMTTRRMPSFCAKRPACRGAAPPKAIMVAPSSALPRSMACTRAALAMFSSTISLMPAAAQNASRPSTSPTLLRSASSARCRSSCRWPPAKRCGSRRPSTRLASVTAGKTPPRP